MGTSSRESPRATSGSGDAELTVSTAELAIRQKEEGTPKERTGPQPDSSSSLSRKACERSSQDTRKCRREHILKEDIVNHFTFCILPSHTKQEVSGYLVNSLGE